MKDKKKFGETQSLGIPKYSECFTSTKLCQVLTVKTKEKSSHSSHRGERAEDTA
jgi:hypothetical protein